MPIETTNGFDNTNNYIEYKSKGDKDKILLPEEYLDIYDQTLIVYDLSNIINDHKDHRKSKVHSGNKIVDYKTPTGWKIQLTI